MCGVAGTEFVTIAGARDGFRVQPLSSAGEPLAEPVTVGSLEIAALDQSRPRWVFDATVSLYPRLLAAGVRLGRAHDIGLAERTLLGRQGRFGEPVGAAAVVARATGAPVPPDPQPLPETVPGLFDLDVDDRGEPADAATLAAALRDQQRRSGSDDSLRLLVAADSTGALAAAEMSEVGVPFDAAVYRELLQETLGPAPVAGRRPRALLQLNTEMNVLARFTVHPDSTVELRAALHRLGLPVDTTRRGELRGLEHPLVPVLLRYKELSRLFTANGWTWLAEWVSQGRFRCAWVPAGVVSGRWAARGGGGLQLPKLTRRAIIAESGHLFVASDAAQLEPRVLAAISGDPVLQRISADDDLYAGLAADGFGGDRAAAKVAMLGAMYGATTGESGRLLPTLRRRYPTAMACVEQAAARGERGDTVRSVLGRASPPPGTSWREAQLAGALPDADEAADRKARSAARSWGRFTRNFVVQASAADWAAVWLSLVRVGLRAHPGAELVLFQHDELLIHTPAETTDEISQLTVTAADQATRLVFAGATARLPVRPVAVRCYADAK